MLSGLHRQLEDFKAGGALRKYQDGLLGTTVLTTAVVIAIFDVLMIAVTTYFDVITFPAMLLIIVIVLIMFLIVLVIAVLTIIVVISITMVIIIFILKSTII